ncbi:polysaccharide pyruvyl transferase family protein [Prevotella communis]|uniref:polysaccharide pyruvyl transferase family protein n=1 Tax=Prevotella communis TaxID=2913614 RepID=UPI001EDBC51B|nr:polysaccharide pyruvyl transferase family protein [Prevotella communis]UKK59574.1 polysaccharide pyruvyl transferase family protein [Prevotella communis]
MKIGIITMHKVLNYGSALQAFALQRKISELGYESEIIDYIFPPHKKTRITLQSVIDNVFVFLRAVVMGFPKKKKERRFQEFYDAFYRLSPQSYNAEKIIQDVPKYDVYMTGSDQVWNPRYIGTDTNFLLSFAPQDKPKISYASSFATSSIPEGSKKFYEKYLKEYSCISVRESTGSFLVQDVAGKKSMVCCDPVFLLNRDQWDTVAEKARKRNEDKYILVYALYYMFDPYPELLQIIDNVQKTLGYKVLYLDGRKEDAFRPNSSVLKAEGPSEFVSLVKNAELVITSSFHGVAFSLIYERPLMAIVRKEDKTDSRIPSLLKIAGAEKSLVAYDSNLKLSRVELYHLRNDSTCLTQYIESSIDYLNNSLNNLKYNKNIIE